MTPDEFFAAEEDRARRVAHIVGITSAARAALAELDERRGAGEDVVIWRVRKKWLVGPRAPAVAALAKDTP